MTDRIDERSQRSGRRPGPDPAEVTPPVERGGSARKRIDSSSEWYWPVVNLIGLVVVVAVNVLANTLPFNGQTTDEVLAGDPVSFQPAGWALAIWPLIYVLLAVFVVYTFLPLGRQVAWMRSVGPAFLVVNLANIAWLVVWHWEQWDLTLIARTILLVVLALLYYVLRRGRGAKTQPPTAERLMVWTPFSVYLGWATVVFLANVSVWLDRTGTELWGMGGRWTAVVLMVLALLATALMVVWQRDPTYGVAVGWGLVAIAAAQWDHSKLVSVSAMIAVVLVAALAVFGSLLAFELRLTGQITTARLPRQLRGDRSRRHESEARENSNRG